MAVHLIAPEALLAALPPETRLRAECVAVEALHDARWTEIEAALAGGDSLIVIGSQALPRLRHLWVDAYDCAGVSRLPVPPWPGTEGGALWPFAPSSWTTADADAEVATGSPCKGISIRPDKFAAYFGHDEMPRLELVPLVEARDGTGRPCGYSGVWLKHFAPSLVGGRFGGSNWYLFAFGEPLAAASVEEWAGLIGVLCDHAEMRLSVSVIRTHYACYRSGETVVAEVGIANHSSGIAAVRLELSAYAPDGACRTTRWIRRCLNGNEEVTVPWEFPAGAEPGLWRVQVELLHENRFVYGARRADESRLVERSECGFVIAQNDFVGFARPAIEGRSLTVSGHDGFLAGTHYYPSSSWWDWAWRDFRPEHAERDIAEMQRLGYSLCRVWIDPELDEAALRGLEAWLQLSGARGIVSIICVFTQWSRFLSYPDGEGLTTFEFMGPADGNVYSVQLLNIEHQQRYIATLARRWRDLPNVIWNPSNEAYVVDPDASQVDAACFGDVEPKSGPLAGAAYINRWADLMTEAIRGAGAEQPILRGYGFVNGGDCYLQNRGGDLLVWHHYAPAEIAGPCLALAAPGLIDKPLLLEEFGIPSLDEAERLERYEGIACWAAAMGAAGACSYEWGVSWLTRELPYVATPLKDSSLVPDPDPRWMNGQIQYSAGWPMGSMGLCPWAASFSYGSNYPCTPFPTPAAGALGEVARFCADIGPPVGTEAVLLVVPMEFAEFVVLEGYHRQLDPTWQAVHALAAAHIPFSVLQVDQLPDLTEAPLAIVFPASQPVHAETRAQLDRLATQGATVHVGPGEACLEALAEHAVAIESGAPVWCIRRGTRSGHLYMLFAPDGPTPVRLAASDVEVALDISRYALVEISRDGTVRQFVGRSTNTIGRQST